MTAEELKSDALVRILPGQGIQVESTVASMYGQAVRADVERAVRDFDAHGFRVEVRDAGSLPCVLRARLHAALARATGKPLPELPPLPASARADRRRRTRLYIPADQPRFFLNAALAGADTVILDLEDAVAPENKLDARAMVMHCAPRLDWGCELAVRVNPGSFGMDDIRATCLRGVDLFLLPKVESVEDVRKAAAVLEEKESPSLLMPLIETAIGVERAFEICIASPRVAAVSLGLEDLVSDLGAQRTEGQEETAWARGRVVNAARAAGIVPLASVFPRFDQPETVFSYAQSARALGYEGIGCIHPSQIAPAHRAFQPTEAELAWARQVVGVEESGATSINGAMVDAPILRRAQRLLQLAGGGS